MKKYILIAGVNGAGKSTLFHVLDELSGMLRVNTDEIVKQFGDWNNKSDVFKAGKESIILSFFMDLFFTKKSSNLVRRPWVYEKNNQYMQYKMVYFIQNNFIKNNLN